MKNYNIIDGREIQFTNEELGRIKTNLPSKIMRRGSERELCISKDKGNYQIWYGTLISGNFSAKNNNLYKVINQMKEYIDKYKDMDEVTFSRLGIKKGICLHCKVKLVKAKDKTYYFCPSCKLCYEKYSLAQGLGMQLWRKMMRALFSKE